MPRIAKDFFRPPLGRRPALGAVILAAVLCCAAAACRSEQQSAAQGGTQPAAGPSERRRQPARESRLRLVFLGDSLTAGHGLQPEESYPALIEERIERAGLPVRTVNAGVSGDTSAGGRRRINWLLRSEIDILVLALGANDGLRGLPPERTEENLTAIAEQVLRSNPAARIIIAGMLVPPNMGEAYSADFEKIFPEVARRVDGVLIPFLLEDVAAEPELNLADGIHPNAEGQRIIAEHVWQALEPVLRSTLQQKGAAFQRKPAEPR